MKICIRQFLVSFKGCHVKNVIAASPSAACPIDRQAVQTTYTVPVGGSVTLPSGVGPGALREHYRARWFKGLHTEVTDANILDGDDFSLQMESLQLSDSGTYYSVVEVCDLPEIPCPTNPKCVSEHKPPISVTVYGENQQGISKCMINRGNNLYFNLDSNCCDCEQQLLVFHREPHH